MTHYVIGHKTRGAIAYRESLDEAADSLLHFMQGDKKGSIYECILAASYVLNGGVAPRVDPALFEWYVVENECDNYDEQYQRIIEEINGLTLKQARHFLEDGEALQFKGIYDIDAVEHVYSIVIGFAPGE
jgi:hypothetical protein